jgi:hypothetical protein
MQAAGCCETYHIPQRHNHNIQHHGNPRLYGTTYLQWNPKDPEDFYFVDKFSFNIGSIFWDNRTLHSESPIYLCPLLHNTTADLCLRSSVLLFLAGLQTGTFAGSWIKLCCETKSFLWQSDWKEIPLSWWHQPILRQKANTCFTELKVLSQWLNNLHVNLCMIFYSCGPIINKFH